ncbi:MAG TPA: 4Fe-4S dicluster domain-containing protein [Chloroflexi bacterium]|nr:4Fe-4S dicluster domain-containing protein [Chloroflexota bacterium]
MAERVYEELADALSLRGGTLPVLKGRELFALLEELFTPEEAELAAGMPIIGPVTAERFAREVAGRDTEKVKNVLEAMADKGTVFTVERNGVRVYTLMPIIPGIFEMQFMKGEVSERARKLARLFDDYFAIANGMMGRLAEVAPGSKIGFPFARVITVEQEIPTDVTVHPYDRVSKYIDEAEDIAVSVCYCRHHGELLGNPCDKPKDVCMTFGPQAQYVAERGFGRMVSKEEAKQVLDRSEEAGLIHCSSNTSNYIGFMCNCCACHCGIIRSVKSGIIPMGAVSSFIVMVDEDECSGCGACVDRCQMEALSLDGDSVVRNAERCIGCGLCISVCPTGALKLELREEALVPPEGQRELRLSLISALQRIKNT